MLIRPLHAPDDLAAVRDLFTRAADYVLLETGLPPAPEAARDYFADAPPGIDPATSLKLGLCEGGTILGLADLAFGWPDPQDAYIGLLLIDAASRGRGLGRRLLDQLAACARDRGATRLLLAVLDDNPRGRAFWEREGFRVILTTPPATLGARSHIRHRMARAL